MGGGIAEIAELPGAMACCASRLEAESKVKAIALRILADRLDREQIIMDHVQFAAS